MITKQELEKLKYDVQLKASIVYSTNNERTRKQYDDAVEKLIKMENEYNTQRKTRIVTYVIGLYPKGSYEGSVKVWEDATEKEIEEAVKKDCGFYLDINL